jgi:hypothetical protein
MIQVAAFPPKQRMTYAAHTQRDAPPYDARCLAVRAWAADPVRLASPAQRSRPPLPETDPRKENGPVSCAGPVCPVPPPPQGRPEERNGPKSPFSRARSQNPRSVAAEPLPSSDAPTPSSGRWRTSAESLARCRRCSPPPPPSSRRSARPLRILTRERWGPHHPCVAPGRRRISRASVLPPRQAYRMPRARNSSSSRRLTRRLLSGSPSTDPRRPLVSTTQVIALVDYGSS